MKINKEDYDKLTNCCVDMETLIALDNRAVIDLTNNTHDIEQCEVLTIIREFVRCKNDYSNLKEIYKNTGKIVINKLSGKKGIILREFETGQIQVLEKIEPLVINTHDDWNTLELSESDVNAEN